ncbi:putative phage abortive infection protein [Marinobacter salarius]|jgi:hypothetical protein|uniref:putative phage abortive infection protein n=1 Tax=Marinobacter salarius TaxID=1420917 RepID=UPI003213D2E1
MKEKSSYLSLWLLFLFATMFGVVVLHFYAKQFGNELSPDQAIWAQFGDYVGGLLGPAFAFLGLIALLITIRIQSKELALSSNELKNSATALSQQSRSLQHQNFENRFFNMLSLHHEIVNGLSVKSEHGEVISGRKCFRNFQEDLSGYLKEAALGHQGPYEQCLLYEYEHFHRHYGLELNHYFRNFYRILKYIDEADVADKKEYSGVLRAQVSNSELVLLFYNGLSPHGRKMKPLAERYALFENFEIDALSNPDQDMHFYNYGAYGDQAEQIESTLERYY